MQTIFGGKIIPELSYKPEEAMKHKNNLYDFCAQFTTAGLKEWMEHMRAKGVPFLVVDRKGQTSQDKGRYVILKRFFFRDSTKKFVAKRCNCNPFDSSQFCLKCNPERVYDRKNVRRAA